MFLIGLWRRWRARAKAERDLRAAFAPKPTVAPHADANTRALAAEMEAVLKSQPNLDDYNQACGRQMRERRVREIMAENPDMIRYVAEQYADQVVLKRPKP